MPVPIRLIALDLDGTLLDGPNLVLPEVIDELLRLAEKGTMTAIATGRPLSDVERIVRANWPPDRPPHALMADEREGFVLRRGRYEPLPDWNERMRRAWEGLCNLAADLMGRFVRELAAMGVRLDPFTEQGDWRERGAVIYVAPDEESAETSRAYIEQALQRLKARPPLRCVRNHRLVALQYERAGKGPTLLEIAKALGVRPDEVLAVGDSLNDLDMLDGRHGFRSAAPVNAEMAVKLAVLRNRGYVAFLPRGRGIIEIIRRMGEEWGI